MGNFKEEEVLKEVHSSKEIRIKHLHKKVWGIQD